MINTPNYGQAILLCSLFTKLCSTHFDPACQAPLSMGFPRQEYLNGLLFPPLRDLPKPGIETASPAMATLAGGFFTMSH